MRRIDNKENIRKHVPHRTASVNNLKFTQTRTIAEINNVSAKSHKVFFDISKAYRILLPDYFNIPKFEDKSIIDQPQSENKNQVIRKMRAEIEVRRKLKDLEILAEGMRRAKNIKEQSRYYYTQGVLLHNSEIYDQSINYFQKFLKIVLFIRDEKSMELALNTIGVEYMQLKNYQKAIQYHKKQGQVNQRADKFVSHINQGLCFQLCADYESALNQYRQAEKFLKMEGDEERKRFVTQVIERADSKSKNLFITSEASNRKMEKSIEIKKQMSRSRNLSKSRSAARFKDEQKVELAISFAQQKMQSFIEEMKNSFLLQNP